MFLAEYTPADVRLCNCCECKKELLGLNNPRDKRLPDEFRDMERVSGRISGRPYCHRCINHEPSGNHGVTHTILDDVREAL